MTTSASCSIAPDSRKSDSTGRLSVRASGCLDSCETAMTGTANSLASDFKYPEIAEISFFGLFHFSS